MAPRMTTQRRVFKGLGNGVLVLMLLWTAIPFYWMIATSLKHDKEIYGYEATLIPERPTLANYATVFRETLPRSGSPRARSGVHVPCSHLAALHPHVCPDECPPPHG